MKIGKVVLSSKEDFIKVVESSKKAFPNWSETTLLNVQELYLNIKKF